MELYFKDIAYNVNSDSIFEQYVLNEEEQEQSEFKNKVTSLFEDPKKASQVLKELGIGSNDTSNNIDNTQIINNLDNLQNIISTFNIQ